MSAFLRMKQGGCRQSCSRPLLTDKTTVAICATVVFLAQSLLLPLMTAAADTRPNVVVIMADDK